LLKNELGISKDAPKILQPSFETWPATHEALLWTKRGWCTESENDNLNTFLKSTDVSLGSTNDQPKIIEAKRWSPAAQLVDIKLLNLQNVIDVVEKVSKTNKSYLFSEKNKLFGAIGFCWDKSPESLLSSWEQKKRTSQEKVVLDY